MSHELQFNVAQLLKEATGGSRSYNIRAKISDELDEDIFVISPLVGHAKFLRAGQNILVTASLHCKIRKICGRCLSSFDTPVSIEIEEEFYPVTNVVTGTAIPEPADADLANRIDEQNILDLTEVVRQELVVAGDSILYCRVECKGLCPECGRDRNVDPCDCQNEQIDARWAGLLTLQIEDEP